MKKLILEAQEMILYNAGKSEISGFLIGVTFNLRKRRNAYRRENFIDLIPLLSDLKQDDALLIESELWRWVKDSEVPDIASKAHEKMRNSRYRSSIGGRNGGDPNISYIVYFAWY